MKRGKHHQPKPTHLLGLVQALLLFASLQVEATEGDSNKAPAALAEASKTKLAWQPKAYPLSHYEKMLGKAPFGKVPVDAPAPVEVEEAPPVEETQLAIAAVSIVEGKPQIYLIDLKTRAYQKVNTEEENESKVRLIEISEESNPREVVAKVTINGRLSTVKYDTGILEAKPKMVAKRNGRAVNTASKRNVPQRPSTAVVQNTARIQNGDSAANAQGAARRAGAPVGPNGGRVELSSGAQIPVPVVRSIQNQRRLSAVPRRRVIVPGRSATQP